MASTDTYPTATITNNLGYDVDIYEVFNPNANTSIQGPFKYTKLATVLNGASAQQVQTIHSASQLQAMRTGNITALNNNYYLQFPVAVLLVSPFADSNAFTLTSGMQQGMEDSYKFIKYTLANPSSQMATNFRTALGDNTSQKTAVNKFFQGTASFKTCTLTTWTAVYSWQAQFTNPWQGTYYLYSLGSSSSSAPALLATLVIAASAQADSAVLKMAGTKHENTSVMMEGDGTMQEQSQGTGNLFVVLSPTWVNITQTSQQNGKTVINYVIGAAFTGKINGEEVTGNLNQLAIPSPSDSSNNSKDKNSANSFTLSSFTQLVGMLISIGMLYYMAKSNKQDEMQKKNDAQEDAKDKLDAEERVIKIKADYQNIEVPLLHNKSVNLESTIVLEVQDGYRQVGQAADVQNKQSTVEKQINELSEVLKSGAPSQATENTAASLEEVRLDLKKAIYPATSTVDRDAAMTDASTKLTNTSNDLKTELQNEGNNLSQQEEKVLSDTMNALNEELEQADSAMKNVKEQEEKTENDQDQEVNENDFNNATEQAPAEFVGAKDL